MSLTHDVAKTIGHALHDVHAGAERLLSRSIASIAALEPRISVASRAFASQGRLPVMCTVDGAGTAPDISWTGTPASTKAIVLVCEDPDAPFPKPFVHWIVYGIVPPATSIDATSLGDFAQGKNSKLTVGFTPAAPPPGHGLHRYHFQVFALDAEPALAPAAGRSAVRAAIDGHVIAWGELVGTYERT